MKKLTPFLFLFYFLIISSVSAQTSAITNGLNYLTSTQNQDGSWGGDTSGTDILPSTVSVIETLQVLNQTNNSNYSNALSWLQLQGLDTTDYLSERIHALAVSGTDNALLISYLDNMTGAWSGDGGPDVDNLDTALALLALKKINYTDQTVINNATNYLLSTQNPDGGWGLYPPTCSGCTDGDDSNVYMTAMVSMTLQQFPQTTSIATAINKATSYLLARQNTDGAFGVSGSTVYETALSYLALTGVTTDATVLGNAINYLIAAQLPDGSWNEDPYSTALALRALANVKPNLSIISNDITFLPN
jgi:large repetitive protein